MGLRERIGRLQQWGRRLKIEAHALYLAARNPRTPWTAKCVALAVAAYALSPIDLIPDFVPVLGFLDELVVLPLGIALAVRLVPVDIMTESRARAAAVAERPVSRIAGAAIIAVWIACLALIAVLLFDDFI